MDLTRMTIGRWIGSFAVLSLLPATGFSQMNDSYGVSFVEMTGAATTADLELDPNEKDVAPGDFDNDGDIDIVVVIKVPFTTSTGLPNVLLMNEGGVFVDRTDDYAKASDMFLLHGDEGFLTATNDRDVVVTDVDGDGWLDIVTAPALGGPTKHISHPRVYRNLGDSSGSWDGFEYQDARIPQLLINNAPQCPKLCGIAAGDVTGNGFPDLYLVDYDTGGACSGDMNDRLLINDGLGYFTDQSTARMTTQMLESAFGTSAWIGDVNGDGTNDIVKNHNAGETTVSYNDANAEGTFDRRQVAQGGAPYNVLVGDFNGDGRPELVSSDDGTDLISWNIDNNLLGMVNWIETVFDFLVGGDDGFGSNGLAVDIDKDGHVDCMIADVDVDISGCSRRLHIYHNRGGAIGAIRTMREEAGTSGWRGAEGLFPNDLTGMHDQLCFDYDMDGDNDLFFFRCNGFQIWQNQQDPTGGSEVGTIYCACSSSAPCSNTSASGGCVNSTGSGALLTGSGSTSVSFNDLTLSMSPMANNEFGIFFTGSAQIGPFSFGDGQRCVGGSVFRFPLLNSGPAGALTLSNVTGIANANFGAGGLWSTGSTWNVQGWYRDPGGACGSSFNLSNGLSLLLTP
jgi:hypothetical protein